MIHQLSKSFNQMKTNSLFALQLVLLYSIAKTSCQKCDTDAILPDIKDELASQCRPTCKKIMTGVEFSDDRHTITPINSTYTQNILTPNTEDCAAHRSAVARINANAYLQGTPINYDSDNTEYPCESVCDFAYEDLMPLYDHVDDLCLNDMIMQIPAEERDTFLDSAESSTLVPSNYLQYISVETCNEYMMYRIRLDETENCVRKCLCEQEVDPVDYVPTDNDIIFKIDCPRAVTDIRFDYSLDVPALASITLETYDPFDEQNYALCEDAYNYIIAAYIFEIQVFGASSGGIDFEDVNCEYRDLEIYHLPIICNSYSLLSLSDETIAAGLTLNTYFLMSEVVPFRPLNPCEKQAACIDFEAKKESYYAVFAEGQARDEVIAACDPLCVGIIDIDNCGLCDTDAILPDIKDELASQCRPTCKKIMTGVEFSEDRQTITPINSTYTQDTLLPNSEECAAHRSAVARINANAYLQGTPINYDSDNIEYPCESVCDFVYEDLDDNSGNEGPKKLSSFVSIGLPLIFGLSIAIFCIGFSCFLALKKSRRSERSNRPVEQDRES